MTNPFVALYESPVETLTAGAYALVLLAFLVATWYAAGRNALTLYDDFQDGWLVLVPFWYTVRAVGMFLLGAIDLLLIAGIVQVLT